MPIPPPDNSDTTLILDDANNTQQIISRQQWKAKPSKPNIHHLKLPLPHAIIQHTASSAYATLDLCIQNVQSIQTDHQGQLLYSDIAYNFLICSDGSIIEGRGWYVEGAHTFGKKFY